LKVAMFRRKNPGGRKRRKGINGGGRKKRTQTKKIQERTYTETCTKPTKTPTPPICSHSEKSGEGGQNIRGEPLQSMVFANRTFYNPVGCEGKELRKTGGVGAVGGFVKKKTPGRSLERYTPGFIIIFFQNRKGWGSKKTKNQSEKCLPYRWKKNQSAGGTRAGGLGTHQPPQTHLRRKQRIRRKFLNKKNSNAGSAKGSWPDIFW